jgi:CDP-2,3-bis-(O-geranylgeranyl)-sn-glycerol synthase
VTGGFIFLFRYNFVQYLPNYTEVYNLYNSLAWSMLFGGILGAGALMGDLIKSFFKRRLGIKPGTMFQPWDGIDYVIGAMIVALPWYNTHFYGIIFLCLIGPALSLLMNTLAYFIGWKERWY